MGMNMEARVFDNILHEEVFKDLVNITLSSNFTWRICDTAYSGSGGVDRINNSQLSFARTFESDEIAKNPSISTVATIIKQALLDAGETMEQGLFRIRWGLLYPKSETDNLISPAHVDGTYPHKTGLIYLNTSDGDTILYNEILDSSTVLNGDDFDIHKVTSDMDFTENTRVNHIANRMLLFPGEQFHSSSLPCKTPIRLTINFNYL
jgi:hypothetical protein